MREKTIIKPPLKWAGGKTQLLRELFKRVPQSFGTYIEPFFWGGALFFALQPSKAIISDSNPELMNFYKQIALNPDAVINKLKQFENTQECFYRARSLNWLELSPAEAAARTLFLNRTCYNGLYRVNRNGGFNVPYGCYKRQKFFDRDNLMRAAELLASARLVTGDYKNVLEKFAKKGDFVFLDPPYVPISSNADFKRYTKEQFYEKDHIELAHSVRELDKKGCHVVLTNSNHPLVREQYAEYELKLVPTKRNVSCNGNARTGEDIIVTISPDEKFRLRLAMPVPEQVKKYPPTRFMGSKSKLLPEIMAVASRLRFDSVIDLFSGSGIVSYLFKSCGKEVFSNDYMAMSCVFTSAMVANNNTVLSEAETESLLCGEPENTFVSDTFGGIYFSDDDNHLIDVLRTNIQKLRDKNKRSIALASLIRACIKKRPRGIFTYVGARYNDGRKDLILPFAEHFRMAVRAVNNAIFDNGHKNRVRMGDALSCEAKKPSLVYIDPPYYSPFSDNEYVRRYHFVEGLARNWEGVTIQRETLTKKFKSYPTPFSSKSDTVLAFDSLFERFQEHQLIVSYSSNSKPSKEEMLELLRRRKKHVRVFPVAYKYSFGNQNHKIDDNRNSVEEFLFVGE
ncbi:MAG: Dam family site-specific DNA-(adenine-N6)-methyltransferase [Clostridiales bacterium]|nr:Dam family site-specific DNA-(adenine-N6)-methyltransferase [Clostridiales bacterium]